MKITIGVHHFLPQYTGGGEWQAYRTAAELEARGHSVQVVCVEGGDGRAPGLTWRDDEYRGLRVRRLFFNRALAPDPDRWEWDNPWVGDHLLHWWSTPGQRPDLFHLFSGYLLTGRTLRAAQLAGVPTVATLLDFWFLCRRISLLRSNGELSTLPIRPETCARCVGEERARFNKLARWLPGVMSTYWRTQTQQAENYRARMAYNLETLNQVGQLISPSEFLRTLHVQAGVSPERFVYSRFGLNFPHLTAQAAEKTPAPGQVRVAYLGQIAHLKGVHHLVEAARQVSAPGLEVKIYGNLERFPGYVRQLYELRGDDARIRFAGAYQDQLALTEILREVDVVVVPSIWFENSPTVILEAFAHGTPVIVSDLGGMAELVREGVNGLRFTMGDSADLARCLRQLVEAPELLPRLRAGIGPVKSVSAEIDELEGYYQAAIADARQLVR